MTEASGVLLGVCVAGSSVPWAAEVGVSVTAGAPADTELDPLGVEVGARGVDEGVGVPVGLRVGRRVECGCENEEELGVGALTLEGVVVGATVVGAAVVVGAGAVVEEPGAAPVYKAGPGILYESMAV